MNKTNMSWTAGVLIPSKEKQAGHRGNQSASGAQKNRTNNGKTSSRYILIPIREMVSFPRFQMKAKIGHATVQQMPCRVKPAPLQV
jgi:hypothetical protein